MTHPTVLVLAIVFLLLSARSAHAYLDPGSGSMMLQLLLGGAAGLGVILKLYWRKILVAIGIRPKEEDLTGGSLNGK